MAGHATRDSGRGGEGHATAFPLPPKSSHFIHVLPFEQGDSEGGGRGGPCGSPPSRKRRSTFRMRVLYNQYNQRVGPHRSRTAWSTIFFVFLNVVCVHSQAL